MAISEKQIDAIELDHGDDFPAQVRSVLRTALLTSQAGADQVERDAHRGPPAGSIIAAPAPGPGVWWKAPSGVKRTAISCDGSCQNSAST